jgi:hypothetical protein
MSIETSTKHKFLEGSNMTFQEVFEFAFKSFIPELHSLAKELGEAQFLEALKKIALESALKDGQTAARQLPRNDFAAFNAWAREPNHFWKHALTFEIVEDTSQAFEVRVTECLWAKTFRELGATDIGYVLICHPDYAYCQGFNPQITMSRSQTLMQGDNYCNHRWVWGG